MTTIGTWLARPFVTWVGWGLVHSVWEAAAVAVVAAITLRALRRASPNARYLVGCGAMVVIGVLPAATTGWIAAAEGRGVGAGASRTVVATRVLESPTDQNRGPNPAIADGTEANDRATVAEVPPRLGDRVAPLLPAMVLAWAAGVLVLSFRLVGGWFLVQRLAGDGTLPARGPWDEAFERLRARMDVRRPVGLLESHELAGRNPAEAERVLMMLRDVWPNFRDTYTQRVCHRMAPADPDRARRLAAAMKDYRAQARAYGVMALALAPTDRAAATRLLSEAFAILERAVEDGKDQWDGLGTASTAAAGLLPIAEAIDPRLVQEYLWRTLALRPPLRGSDKRDGIADLSNAQVAAMAARYDRIAARAVLDAFAAPAVARLGGLARTDQSFQVQSVFTAAAIVDPTRAVELVEGLPNEADTSPPALKNAARLAVAKVLASEGPDRWRNIEGSLLHLWPIDSELR